MKKLNEIITEIRKKHKISRKGIEELTGFKERTIASYERGERVPSSEYLQFISIYFNYELEYLVQGDTSHFMTAIKLAVIKIKYIFNITDKDISNILNMTINHFYKFINALNITDDNLKLVLDLVKEYKIKPSSFGFIFGTNRVNHQRLKRTLENDIMRILIDCEQNEDFIHLTDNYYLSILKKRNNPKYVFIPNNFDENLNEEHKRVLELLNYAPKEFIDKLIIKLETFKHEQKDFFK